MKNKFYILSTYGEMLDVALHLQDIEGCEVVFSVPDQEYSKIGEGMIKKDNLWFNYLGQGYTFIIDGCENSQLQEYLRSKGEFVFGNGGKKSADIEDNRQLGQKICFPQPESKNFTSIDDALKFVQEHKDKRWVMKQNGSAPKHLNFIGKFDNNEDMIFHLNEIKKKWNESEWGKFDVDLMEFVEGTECAISAFFNGTKFLKDEKGKVVAYINFEEKKSMTGGLGVTCGEMGTTFIGADENTSLVKEVLMNPKLTQMLKKMDYRGVFDINGTKTKDKYIAFEFTCRPGIPATSYEFLEGLDMKTSDLINIVAKGENKPIKIHKGIGMVMVVVSKPFPTEADIEPEATSIGEKLWILEKEKPIKDFTKEQKKHIHLENFYKEGDDYRVATKSGYLLTVTNRGKTIKESRESLIEYIKDNLKISDMFYRTDIGARIEKL